MISTRGRYALRMMVDLAENQGDGFVALKDIAERQNISKKYLEQIIPVLNRASLLQTSRGFGGGYRLAKSPGDYTVGEILTATEGTLAPVACLEGEVNTCQRRAECDTLFVWEGLKKTVDSYLGSITIQDIIDKKNGSIGNDYSI
ncbi:MAG: RrF2 family transcriptional regulator [Clostridia bacterium]|nr:RrF2 family transcriptional regulator [Clostridia bacterium]